MQHTEGTVHRNKKATLFLMVAFALGIVVALGGLSLTTAMSDSDIIAVINGKPLTQEAFFQRIEEELGEQFFQQFLEEMIFEALLEQAPQTHGIEVTDEQIEAEIAEFHKLYGSEEAFLETLPHFGLTLESLTHRIRLALILDALSQQGIEVTDEEIAEFFEENKEALGEPEAIAVRHILVDTEDEAKAIAKELADGADFAELASSKSLDTASAVQGGSIGLVYRDSPYVVPFKEAAFQLEVGEISAPVETQFGWHLIQVTEKREAKEATLESSADRVRSILLQQKARSIDEIYEDLQSKATIEIKWSRFSHLGN